MAFDSSNLSLISSVNGYGFYRYDTMDAHAVIDTDGYFNNSDDDQKLNVGDFMYVVVWATSVRTGTISTYGTQIVNAVTSAGVVDTSDVTVNVVTDTD